MSVPNESKGTGQAAPAAVGAPSFSRPPITELAVAIQFQTLPGIRALNLGSLRARWRAAYPSIEEHPPLMPAIETAPPLQVNFQLNLGPGFTSRYWFVADGGEELIQVQNDRFILNWRKLTPNAVYPRYKYLRAVFVQRLGEFIDFLKDEQLGTLEITQGEINYINLVDSQGSGARLEAFLRMWAGVYQHHLGEPEQARAALVFNIDGLGKSPSRLHVSVDPAEDGEGGRAYFMTLTARGAPMDGSVERALEFIDGAHEHATQSFVELTTDAMHEKWGMGQ